jgi:Mrp family chromosome partitioning ATPase
MLEALKQAPTPRPTPRLAPLPADPSTSEAPAIEENDVEIPFIEWGPRKSMEASPSVLAAPGPAKVPRVADETAVALVEPTPRILFRPLPTVRSAGKPAPELAAFYDPDGPISAQYRQLLNALLAARPVEEPQAWLFMAAHPGTDSTATLLNTAIAAARLGRRRLAVVDANLANPAVAAALGLPEKPGLREVLAGTVSLDDALQETAQPDLVALTAGVAQATGGVRFLAETTRSLLRHLRQRFDLIFVAGPPCRATAEATPLAASCDAVYVVVRPTETDTPETDDLLRRLPEQGAKLTGCIIAGS